MQLADEVVLRILAGDPIGIYRAVDVLGRKVGRRRVAFIARMHDAALQERPLRDNRAGKVSVGSLHAPGERVPELAERTGALQTGHQLVVGTDALRDREVVVARRVDRLKVYRTGNGMRAEESGRTRAEHD